MTKRVFLIVLDSLGIGALPDYAEYDNVPGNTFESLIKYLKIPTLTALGIGNIDGVKFKKAKKPIASFGRFKLLSKGKDTTIGHFELCGIQTNTPYPTFPNGFPKECIAKLEKGFGIKILCNKPYSGTEVIKDFGNEHLKTKKPIIYTSADSVLQIATHETVYSPKELYDLCEKARKIMTGKWGVNRIIARPFDGKFPNFYRTENRKDFALAPPSETALDVLKKSNKDVISIGKICDVFSGYGITKHLEAHNNTEVGTQLLYAQELNFEGLCFANFNDFDSKYGHRNNIEGYANALNEFDNVLKTFIPKMKEDDVLFITADHGNDPSTQSTDHNREYTPCLIVGENINSGINLHTISGLFNISATILDIFNIPAIKGESFLNLIRK